MAHNKPRDHAAVLLDTSFADCTRCLQARYMPLQTETHAQAQTYAQTQAQTQAQLRASHETPDCVPTV